MTWLKLSDDFADACADLSDAAFRTHVEGLAWVMRRETGGTLSERDVRRLADTANPETAIAELLELGHWQREGNGYRIVHHMEHQPEPDVIAKRRAKEAERQRRQRRKKLGLDEGPPSRLESRRDLHRDDMRDPGRDGSGRDGLPRASQLSGSESDRDGDGEVDEWLSDYDNASAEGDGSELMATERPPLP